MDEIKAGDLVTLKSGGQLMTVEEIHEKDHAAACVWYDHEELKRAIFPLETLRKSEGYGIGCPPPVQGFRLNRALA